MSAYDARVEQGLITSIIWSDNPDKSLTRVPIQIHGISVKSAYLDDKNDVVNFIKALNKAVELGWVK